MLPTVIHKLYSYFFNYFWMSCERCGKEFGGHQWEVGGAMEDGFWRATKEGWYGGARCAYCPQCAKTRDTWEPNWRERRDNPEIREQQ